MFYCRIEQILLHDGNQLKELLICDASLSGVLFNRVEKMLILLVVIEVTDELDEDL